MAIEAVSISEMVSFYETARHNILEDRDTEERSSWQKNARKRFVFSTSNDAQSQKI
jgi:hypothetical protein